MDAHPIFTIRGGDVEQGAVVTSLFSTTKLRMIPAIMVGENGRQFGVLPVTLTDSQQNEWWNKGSVTIFFASVDESDSKNPVLVAADEGSRENFIGVFRTPLGERGENDHTGGRAGYYKPRTKGITQSLTDLFKSHMMLGGQFSLQEVENFMKNKGLGPLEEIFEIVYDPFPGQKIVEGKIVRFADGKAYEGDQFVALMPYDHWFRTSVTGVKMNRDHHYFWDGSVLQAFTWEERLSFEALENLGYTQPNRPWPVAGGASLPSSTSTSEERIKEIVSEVAASLPKDIPGFSLGPIKPGAKIVQVAPDFLLRMMLNCTDVDTVEAAAQLIRRFNQPS